MEPAATKLGRPHRIPAKGQPYECGALIVGKYRLEAQLGEGGMGTVWLARNETLDAPVALKLIRSGMQCEETVERLLLEARVEAKLRHPNIVRVFDFGQTELGDAFIVMEVLDGISLGALLDQRGHLDAIEAVQLVLPVIGALCHAHENGVMHRDLKPQNIFLDRGGLHTGTKLLDFGIAKLTDDFHRHFTEGGSLIGSPAYMAPEQARASKEVDHRADIWGICVVLYEAVSGAPAFSGEGYVVLRKVIDDELPALKDTGAGEAALWRILSHGLEKNPARRFQSMRELGTALAQWLCDHGASEDLDGNRISQRWGVTLAADESPPPRVRPRRRLQELALPPGAKERFARALRARGPSQRAAAALRLGAAFAFAVALMTLAPSRIGGEPATAASAEHVQLAPVAAESPIHLAWAEPTDLPVSRARPTPAAATPSKRPPQEPSYPKRSTQRLMESDLGLKVPY
jgi:serine/threonine-protein kinase